ncbi:murein biosynthesis integral membrane protein MurJ [Candidatus Curtissbacteria bacterium RBG_16_39_7]|uniref:Probable lipid II flippase MurJ n=1 Tax=Candidatus Curtissbacteria bacterium RBG_16_39_7 TaxID=1797707 RepID=A0A1F5G382_9BACT|nr:MAG: murein biosynthesis integral membrane protein MurJ [Candidatus Curtissbacteria bacterium RBG_16_39_7]
MLNNFLKNGAKLLLVRQTTILSAATVIAASIVLSRILGLVRYRLLAAYFGQDIGVLDTYVVASIIPESIFEILIFGSISVAFIPVFSSLLAKGQKKDAWELVSSVINLGLLAFLFLASILFLFSPQLALIIAPGLTHQDPQALHLLSNLIRVMLISQLFFVVSVFLTGILQSFGHFLFPAIAAVFYNLGIIFGIIFFSPLLGIFGPAWGMALGAFLHLLIQIPFVLSLGVPFRFKINFSHSAVRKVLVLMWPRALNLLAIRANDLVSIALASLLVQGSIVAFNFAQVLQFVPVGLFGASIAQAALPIFSAQIAKNNLSEFKETFLSSFHQILFLSLPIMALISILRIPAVRLVFGAAQFPWPLTIVTSQVLILFSFSIAAQALILLLLRGFYAFHDPKTPVVIGFISVFLNISLSIFFVLVCRFPVQFLALSYSVSSIFNALLLFIFLDAKIGRFDRRKIIAPFLKLLTASIFMAVALYIPFKILDMLLDTTRTINLIILTVVSSSFGILVFAIFARVLKIKEAAVFFTILKRLQLGRRSLPPEVLEPPS